MRIAGDIAEGDHGSKAALYFVPLDTSTMILESHEGHGKGRATIDFGRLVARGEQQCERHGLKVEQPSETLRLRRAVKTGCKFGPS